MCASCVAQSTPLVVAGFGLLRRRALTTWLRTTVLRRPGAGPAVGERPGPAATSASVDR